MSLENAVEAENIVKTYPGIRVLDELSFTVKKNSLHGFLGPNGAGKSTTLNILSNLIPADSGEVRIYGRCLSEHKKELHQIIGYLPEQAPLYAHMRVKDFLNFVHSIYALNGSSREKMVNLSMERMGIHSVKNKFIGVLSKGYKQRVGLAMAMVHAPSLLVLDEPFVGLDPGALGELRDVLLELSKEHTVLFSSHLLDEVQKLCSDVTVIQNGRQVYNGSTEDFLNFKEESCTMLITSLPWSTHTEHNLKKQFDVLTIAKLKQKEVINKLDNKCTYQVAFNKTISESELATFFFEQKTPVISIQRSHSNLEDKFNQIVTHEVFPAGYKVSGANKSPHGNIGSF